MQYLHSWHGHELVGCDKGVGRPGTGWQGWWQAGAAHASTRHEACLAVRCGMAIDV